MTLAECIDICRNLKSVLRTRDVFVPPRQVPEHGIHHIRRLLLGLFAILLLRHDVLPPGGRRVFVHTSRRVARRECQAERPSAQRTLNLDLWHALLLRASV